MVKDIKVKKTRHPLFKNERIHKIWEETFGKKSRFKETTIPFKKMVFGVVFLDLFLIIVFFLLQRFLPPEIPIFYGLPEGQEQLGDSHLIVIPLVLSVFIVIFNSITSLLLKDEILKKILILGGVSTSLFAIITVFKIFFLIGRL